MTSRGLVIQKKKKMTQNLENSEDTILSMINEIEHESEKKENKIGIF